MKAKIIVKNVIRCKHCGDVIEMLDDDDETGLYGKSALYLLSLFDEQSKNKSNTGNISK